jgi:hypothetical protein
VHLCRVRASSGTCGCIDCGFSCYCWLLPPPRWLGVAVGDWHKLELIRGHPDPDCEGFLTFLRWRAKRYSSGSLVSLSYPHFG